MLVKYIYTLNMLLSLCRFIQHLLRSILNIMTIPQTLEVNVHSARVILDTEQP